MESENRKCACALSVLRFSVFGAQPVFPLLACHEWLCMHACLFVFDSLVYRGVQLLCLWQYPQEGVPIGEVDFGS